MSKKRITVLKLEDKLKIVKERNSGDSVANIANKYKIGEQTVHDIYKSPVLPIEIGLIPFLEKLNNFLRKNIIYFS